MSVMITAFKSFQGKVKKVNKKEVLKTGQFRTPPCLVSPIPEGTIYYEIILEKGALKETLSLPDKEILKSKVKLIFFELPYYFTLKPAQWGEPTSKELDLEINLLVGKDYHFSTQSWSGGHWVISWKEISHE